MAPNIVYFLVLTFLLFMTVPFIVQSENSKLRDQGFNFLWSLEGCHKDQVVKGLTDLKRYLERFGYLNYSVSKGKNATHANDDEFDELLDSAIKAYQANYHLNISGILDANTIKEMELPRCGVADFMNKANSKTNRTIIEQSRLIHPVSYFAFFPGMPTWPRSKTHLTYRFSSTAPVVPIGKIRSVCNRAFKRWQHVSRFTFQEVSGKRSDIVIGLHRKDHGLWCPPFDGPGGILGHAFAPTNGRIHFDADEKWSTNPTRSNQVDLESVAVHEIGHVLGLAHSNVKDSIMYAKYPGGIKRDLHSDDIKGIRILYRLASLRNN